MECCIRNVFFKKWQKHEPVAFLQVPIMIELFSKLFHEMGECGYG